MADNNIKYYLLLVMKFFKKLFGYNFQNWTKNISNANVKIVYPKKDADIQDIVYRATQKNRKIRVAGSCHSISPMIVDNDTENIIIISLEKYQSDNDISFDHEQKMVTVNAGWKLGRLCDELNKYNYLLETQTASSAFSVGGVCCMPVHGSRLGACMIADSVVAIRLVDDSGRIVTVTETDTNFNLYRLNYGIFGVVTHVTLKLIRVNNLSATTITNYNVFYDDSRSGFRLKRNVLDPYFKSVIKDCISPKQIRYNQCFIDCHNNTMLTIDWTDDDKPYLVDTTYPDIQKINTLHFPELYFGSLDRGYRQNNKILKMAGLVARYNIMYNIENNMSQDRDMFWVETALRGIFMSYFIPIYHEDTGEHLDNIYQAIEYVMDLSQEYHHKKFNIDFPIGIRFVVSNHKSRLSPLYHTKKIVYAAIEIISAAYNIETDSSRVACGSREINYDFRQFFSSVEKKWISLGGIPHIAKVYGFGGENNDPFDKNAIARIFDDQTKNLIQKNAKPLFTNHIIDDFVDGFIQRNNVIS